MALVDSQIKIPLNEIREDDLKELLSRCTFNPQDDLVATAYKLSAKRVRLPRGILAELPEYLDWQDRRSFPKLPRHEITIELDADGYEGQREAVEAILEKKQGVVHRQPGKGKTEIQLAAIAQAGTRALVIVHTEDLLEQWLDRAEKTIPTMSRGIVRGGKIEIGQITVAMLQTLYSRGYGEEFYRQFGYTVFDECHHVPAATFEYVINLTTSRYRLGTTASETRADGMHPLMNLFIGPTIHDQPIDIDVPVFVKKATSDFRFNFKPTRNEMFMRIQWQRMMKALVDDFDRNKLIAEETDRLLLDGRSVLVLSRRIDHLQNIKALMWEDAEILAAKLTPKAERRRIIAEFKKGNIKCLLATQLADEGLDAPIISGVVLAYPSKHKDKLFQQVGRSLRLFPGKDSTLIVDICDKRVKTLNNQWRSRRSAYRDWGFPLLSRKGKRKLRGVILKANRKRAKVAFNGRSR